MTREELNQKISVIVSSETSGNIKRDAHIKLSIEFAINVLEDMLVDDSEFFTDPFDVYMNQGLREKIKELKQYLNG